MAEAQHDMQDALQRYDSGAEQSGHDRQASRAIEASARRHERHAYWIAEQGQTIGPPGQRIAYRRRQRLGRPDIHLSGAPEVAYEARTLERMGAATFEYEPQYRTLEAWQAAGNQR